jgi:hypothetical protein
LWILFIFVGFFFFNFFFLYHIFVNLPWMWRI